MQVIKKPAGEWYEFSTYFRIDPDQSIYDIKLILGKALIAIHEREKRDEPMSDLIAKELEKIRQSDDY
jgi:hypothetical protein